MLFCNRSIIDFSQGYATWIEILFSLTHLLLEASDLTLSFKSDFVAYIHILHTLHIIFTESYQLNVKACILVLWRGIHAFKKTLRQTKWFETEMIKRVVLLSYICIILMTFFTTNNQHTYKNNSAHVLSSSPQVRAKNVIKKTIISVRMLGMDMKIRLLNVQKKNPKNEQSYKHNAILV